MQFKKIIAPSFIVESINNDGIPDDVNMSAIK